MKTYTCLYFILTYHGYYDSGVDDWVFPLLNIPRHMAYHEMVKLLKWSGDKDTCSDLYYSNQLKL